MLYTEGLTNITTLQSKLILHLSCLLVFFIDAKTECTNTAFNWTCPGGYLLVERALWTKDDRCVQTSDGSALEAVTKNVQNECDNKTSCTFTVTNFGVSCAGCSALLYSYDCISKSLVLLIFLIIFFINLTRKQ